MYVMAVIHASLWEGVMPQLFKEAVVHSLLKRPLLDSIPLDNFHPVSNLPFLEMFLEKMVTLQFLRFLDEALSSQNRGLNMAWKGRWSPLFDDL